MICYTILAEAEPGREEACPGAAARQAAVRCRHPGGQPLSKNTT